jgi:Fic family protein
MLYLKRRDYDFRDSLALDSYYAADRQEYYQALNLANNYTGRKTADLSSWLEYFSAGFLSSAKVLLTEVLLLASVVKDPREMKRVGKDETDLLSYAKQFGAVSLAEAREILPGVSRRTLQRRLKTLVDNGYFELSGRTSRVKYVIKK